MTQKLAETRQQLFQSDKMASLERLAAGVAHEINNPLTGILTYASFLLKRTKDQPDLHSDLEVMVRETVRSREIVKGLLDFARQSIPKKIPTEIHEVIDRALKVLMNQFSLNNIKIEKNYASQLPAIYIDPNQMQQVFSNPLVNAQQAIGTGSGKITIQTDRVRLSPYGKVQIKQALCPKGHDLMDAETHIDGLPSIKLKIMGKESFIYLDPIYGRNYFKSDIPIKVILLLRYTVPNAIFHLLTKRKNALNAIYRSIQLKSRERDNYRIILLMIVNGSIGITWKNKALAITSKLKFLIQDVVFRRKLLIKFLIHFLPLKVNKEQDWAWL